MTETGRWQFLVEAWTDRAATWRDELRRRVEGGEEDLASELAEGAALLGIENLDVETALASTVSDRHGTVRSAPLELDVDPRARPLRRLVRALPALLRRLRRRREGCCLGSPSSASTSSTSRRSTRSVAPGARAGTTRCRRSRGDPGSPWAIGAKEGGHDAIHPDLGTLADFDRLVATAKELGIEVALDFAIQCSPDHPWLKEHPDWFQHRPDGTIKYAENPPKRYQDIVNVDWECEDWRGLWEALRDVVLHWMRHGVRVFRVDNPHTKPLPFWEWLIAEVRAVDQGVVFLAEAFTRPAMMHELAKVGINQSYTYFTWRNSRWELEEYVTELATEEADYFRPNFFVNTPDILSPYLVEGGRPGVRGAARAGRDPVAGLRHLLRLRGMRERADPRPGSEEYLDSEKYELKKRQHRRAAACR